MLNYQDSSLAPRFSNSITLSFQGHSLPQVHWYTIKLGFNPDKQLVPKLNKAINIGRCDIPKS